MFLIIPFHSSALRVLAAHHVISTAVSALRQASAVPLNAVVPTLLSVRLALLALGHIHIANIPNTTAPIAPNRNSTKSSKSVHANHFFDLYPSSSLAILHNGNNQNKANTTIIKDVTHAFAIISLPFQPRHDRFGCLHGILGGLFRVVKLVGDFNRYLFCEVGGVYLPIAVREFNFHGGCD